MELAPSRERLKLLIRQDAHGYGYRMAKEWKKGAKKESLQTPHKQNKEISDI